MELIIDIIFIQLLNFFCFFFIVLFVYEEVIELEVFKFVVDIQILEVSIYDKVKFICKVIGKFILEIFWYKNDKEIFKIDNRFII